MSTSSKGLFRGALGLALLFGAGLSGATANAGDYGSVFDRCGHGIRGCYQQISGWKSDCCCEDECCYDECCDDVCCDTCCCDGCGWCNLGDPWRLQDAIYGDYCGCPPFEIGGWTQIGYHSNSTGMFNSHPDQLRLHQQYLYAERVADGSCGFDWGFRADVVFGADGPDTQAFGGEPSHWDLDLGTGGGHGWAFPQLYGEFAYCDTSVKVGHFYTLVGYEVVTAPDNFFYSHAYTMYNSEPFTHTGILVTQNVSDSVTAYGGWVDGWDTGFEFSGGSQFIGGASVGVNDNVTVTYIFLVGDRETNANGTNGVGVRADGYNHSVVVDVALTDQLNYIIQSDFVDYNESNQHQYGVNQYLIYWYNDCLGFGSRFEWWHTNEERGPTGAAPNTGSSDVYALTAGVNIKPHANFIVRPEVRWDWNDDQAVNNLDGDTTFGIDAILTY